VSLEQPIVRDEGQELRLGVIGELRESRTQVLNTDFCTITDAQDCDPQVTALRIFQQYTASSQRSALALRSSFSVGIDAFGATHNPGKVADGEFFAWLGQLQAVHRLGARLGDSLVVARVDTQLSADPLLPIEKFSVGGSRTVRGYRENQLVRDSGVVASLELRVPILRQIDRQLSLELAPFADFGHAWDESGPGKLETDTLASLGAGLRLDYRQLLRAEFYYGARLISAERAQAPGLQREGMHFAVTLDAGEWIRAGVRRWWR
jgi:hemolysin activation/secretion protein